MLPNRKFFSLKTLAGVFVVLVLAAWSGSRVLPVSIVREIPLIANDIVYDPASGLIYASLPSTVGATGNSIQPIDPVNGTTGFATYIGSEPRIMAVSDDGQYLYVELRGAASIQRVELATMTPGLTFTMGNTCHGPCYAEDMEVMPGSPHTVAVSKRNIGYSPKHEGVAIYDDGVQRTNMTQDHTGSNVIEFASPTRIYGYTNETTDYGFRRLTVDVDGVTEETTTRGLISGFYLDIEYDNGLIYATSGKVIHPENLTVMGTYASSGLVEPVSDWNRTFFYSNNTLYIYNQQTFLLIDTIYIPGAGSGIDLIHWGDGNLALLTDSTLYLIDISQVSNRPSDLQAFATGETGIDLVWSDNSEGETGFYIERSPDGQSGWEQIGASSTATFSDTGLACGETWYYRVYAYWDGSGAVSNMSNTAYTTTYPCSPNTATIREIPLIANDIVYDPASGLIYASLPSTVGATGNSIQPIDPVNGTTGFATYVGSEPRIMAVSDDGQYLYVELRGAASILRVDLATMTPGLTFTMGNTCYGPCYAEDMEVMPGSPHTVAVSKRNIGYSPKHEGVAIYDDGVQRTNMTQRHTGSNVIEFASPTRIYGYTNETTDYGFRRLTVDVDGVTQETTTSGLISGFYLDIEYDNGLIYATSGKVIHPENLTVMGTYASSGLVEPVSDWNRTFFYSNNTLYIYNQQTFLLIDTIYISGAGSGIDLIHWGDGNLALLTDSKLYLIDVPEPEIGVKGNEVSISDGDTTPSSIDDTAFGNLMVGTEVTHTFTIENTGTGSLTIDGDMTVTGSAAFTVTDQPDSSVAPSGSTTFDVTCTPSAQGSFTAMVSIPNSDADENPYTFDVSCSSGPTTLIAPDGSIGTDATPTYSWSEVTGAIWYRLYVTDAATSAVVINQWYDVGIDPGSPDADCSGGTCAVTPATALPDGSYQWWVRTWNPAGFGPWSAGGAFIIDVIPNAATLIAPSGTVSDPTPRYEWSEVTNATHYQLYVLDDTTANVVLDTTYTSAEANCAAGTCWVEPGTALSTGHSYRWWVRTSNAYGDGPWSAKGTFAVSLPLPGAATLIAPVGTITTPTPAYTWSEVSNATHYRLVVVDDVTATAVIDTTYTSAEANCAAGTCWVEPGTALSHGHSYRWWVRTSNAYGDSPWSAKGTFAVSLPLPGAATLIAPSGTITAPTPTYEWSEVGDATHYRLYVLDDVTSTTVIDTTYTSGEANCAAGTCSITPATALSHGHGYRWWVRTANAYGDGPWSAKGTFAVSLLPPAAAPITPSGTITGTTPTYTWSEVANATHYRLYVLDDTTATTVIDMTYTSAEASCSGGTCWVAPGTALTIGHSYRWWVRTANAYGDGPWSAKGTFTVAAAGLRAPGGVGGLTVPAHLWHDALLSTPGRPYGMRAL